MFVLGIRFRKHRLSIIPCLKGQFWVRNGSPSTPLLSGISLNVSKFTITPMPMICSCILYLSFKPEQQVVDDNLACIEACIREIRQWMKANFLKLNDDKTEFILLGSQQQLDKVTVHHITIGGSNIIPVKRVRNLGVIMDSTMSLQPHISHISQTTANSLRNLSRIRKHLSKQATEQLVHAFITSRLDMCNSLLFGIHQQQLNQLQRRQNTAARLITRTRRSSHITPILQHLHWLPIKFRIMYKLMLLTYRSLHNTSPPYLSTLLAPYHGRSGLRSANQQLLAAPRSHRSWGDRSFHIAAPRLWNSLPINIRSGTSLSSFKIALKTHYFNLAYITTS